MPVRFAGIAIPVVLATLAAVLSVTQAQQGADEVDTALIVAVDVSNSVDDKRYRLQMEGIAQALEDPGVIQAIVGGAKGGILFSMITWADRQKVSLPWTRIASAEEARAAARKVRALPRESGEFTCMSRMMRYVSDKIVPQVPVKAVKVVLDISGDGRDNCNAEEPIEGVRDELVKFGVTVNGLPILEGGAEEPLVPGAAPSQSYLPEEQKAAAARGVVPRARQGRAGVVRAACQRLRRLRPGDPPEVRARGQHAPRLAPLARYSGASNHSKTASVALVVTCVGPGLRRDDG